jgi:PhzF family phenazine biosynthesis protein
MMTRIPFTQIDAFADATFGGNPAGVMALDRWLADDVLQAIAAENNLSETAFIVPADGVAADYELRWFTPTVEVALCGHATLASGHFVLTSGAAPEGRVRFVTRKAGVLEVARVDGTYEMALPSYPTKPEEMPAILAGLRLDTAVATRWHPAGYGLVVVDDAAIVRTLAPDFGLLRQQSDTLTIVTAPGAGDPSGADVVSRVFAAAAGIDEDPVTGSAHAVLTPYWAEILGRERFSAYQASTRGGRIGCRLAGDRVVLSGQCVTVIEGTFLL